MAWGQTQFKAILPECVGPPNPTLTVWNKRKLTIENFVFFLYNKTIRMVIIMRKKGVKNLTFTQRIQIETLFNAKINKTEIAKQVGVCLRTVQRELKRGEYEHTKYKYNFWYGAKYSKVKKYSATIAHEKYKMNCTAKGRPLKVSKDFAFINYINNRVKRERITAHAVWGEMHYKNLPFQTKISKTTLYNYIRLGLFENIQMKKRKEKYKKSAIKRVSRGISIEKRPDEIKQRNTFGHWELDCLCGSTRACFFVMTERLTRHEIIFKMPDQSQKSVISCIDSLERKYKSNFPKIFKSITVDNGSEFKDFRSMERSVFSQEKKRTAVYYCHPYCSCERGTNERMNREIRRIIPKGTDLSKCSDSKVKEIERWINYYPRKVLGFACSQELFDKQLQALS